MNLAKVLNFEQFKLKENLVWDDKPRKKEFKVGDKVIYVYKDKSIDDWMDLSDEERKKPEEKPASDIVGVKKIEKIEGDKLFFTDKNGKEFSKNKGDIINKTT